MQHIKKKPTQFNHKIHCFCSKRFPWLGQGTRQTGPGGRRWMEGEVSSICPPQEPSQDTGSREPRGQPWAGQVFLLVTQFRWRCLSQLQGLGLEAAARRETQPAPGSPDTSPHMLLPPSTWWGQRVPTLPLCLRIIGTVFLEHLCLGRLLFKRSGWRLVICFAKSTTGNSAVQPELGRNTSWETQCLQGVIYFTLWLHSFKDEVWKACLNEHRTWWSWSQFALPGNYRLEVYGNQAPKAQGVPSLLHC